MWKWRIGHFAKVCRGTGTHQNRVYANNACPAERIESSEEEPQVEINVRGQEVNVLIDSGASFNVID